ncbi:MAG: cytochrome C [Gammaproteobacteria bacterium]|nr:MAG: cytochrome C [Gammaproteobacteria bacterium]
MAMFLASLVPAHASTLERLMMPGPVIAGHAKVEQQCKKCHRAFRKRRQSDLCLKCHDKVAADIRGHRGWHGRDRAAAVRECRTCHADHLGRKAKIVSLDRSTFDHDETDFPLHGAHQSVACEHCHERGKKYREAPHACKACHAEDSPHGRAFDTACRRCHTETTWHRVRFDHGKTDFPLEGKHARAACNACHPDNRFPKIPTRCVSCHRIDDAHAGQYGTRCGKCHDARSWKKARFDHGKTDFPLRGAHRRVTCEACHTPQRKRLKIDTACVSCHRKEDIHLGAYGKRCARCHDERGWSRHRAFDHDGKTKFPLRGAHRKVACALCHKGKLTEAARRGDCHACHGADDVHQGKLGRQCGRCHNPRGWHQDVVFEHDLTAFPLIGLHAVAPCEACHGDAGYGHTPEQCADCHGGDDFHEGHLPKDCDHCHTPNGWRLWRFDHDTQTDFKLDGAHADLACGDCHKTRFRKRTSPRPCDACHRSDDVHEGRFGRDCAKCHTTRAFNDPELFR